MDYRTGIHVVRALVSGVPDFVTAVESSPDFEPDAFRDFAKLGNIREWLAPVAGDPRARELLSDAFVAELVRVGEAQPAKKRALLEMGTEIQSAFEAADVPVLFLKGLYMGRRFHGDIHRRHQYDLDALVHRDDFERAVDVLGTVGLDTKSDAVERRMQKFRERDPRHAPQTIAVRRPDKLQVDLHWSAKGRMFPGLPEDAFWTDRQTASVGDWTFETISDDHHLLLLLVSLCLDLRGSAGRVKHFLDLYLMLRNLESDIDWDAYLEDCERRGLLEPVSTVLAMLLMLWRCADEFPELARALEPHRGAIRLRDPDEAVRIITRPRNSLANRAWFLTVRGPSTFDEWRRALTVHSPALAWRACRPRRQGEGWPWEQVSAVAK